MTLEQKTTTPNFLATFCDLQGGVVQELTTRLMADVAMATAEVGDARKKGKLILTFEMAPGKSEGVIEMKHTISYVHPTAKGKKSEEVSDEQIMFVNRKGALTPVPDNQGEFEFGEEIA